MTLTELRYIVAVSHEKHFGRAARACHVSQPTLSIAIKKLEEELGVQLFERKASEITVTPVGERIIEQAQRTLEAADGVRLAAREGKDQLAGPVRIGAIYTIGPYLFPDLIPRLRKHAPDMPLVIEENFTAVLAEKLKQGELDVIIISLPFKEQGILTLPLYDEPFVVLLPAAHPLTQRKFINSKQLENEPVLLLGAGHCFRDQVLDLCSTVQRGPRGALARTMEGGSLETIRQMVASGVGVTVLPATAVHANEGGSELIRMRPFARPVPDRRVVLAWRKSFPRPQAVEALRQAILACDLPQVTKIH